MIFRYNEQVLIYMTFDVCPIGKNCGYSCLLQLCVVIIDYLQLQLPISYVVFVVNLLLRVSIQCEASAKMLQ